MILLLDELKVVESLTAGDDELPKGLVGLGNPCDPLMAADPGAVRLKDGRGNIGFPEAMGNEFGMVPEVRLPCDGRKSDEASTLKLAVPAADALLLVAEFDVESESTNGTLPEGSWQMPFRQMLTLGQQMFPRGFSL